MVCFITVGGEIGEALTSPPDLLGPLPPNFHSLLGCVPSPDSLALASVDRIGQALIGYWASRADFLGSTDSRHVFRIGKEVDFGIFAGGIVPPRDEFGFDGDWASSHGV
jgi:hypothetical protein